MLRESVQRSAPGIETPLRASTRWTSQRTPPNSATQSTASDARRCFEGLIGTGQRREVGNAPVSVNRALHDVSTSLLVGVAESIKQKEAVDHFIRRRYAWRGYSVEAVDQQGRLPKVERSQCEIVFYVAKDEQTLGTITLGLDSDDGLRAEMTHRDAIQGIRSSGQRVGELTRLAVAEGSDSRAVLASLFGLVYAVGRTIHGVTTVFIEINPRHVAFYCRALGFVVLGEQRYCERVGAPSVLLRLDVASLEQRLRLDSEPRR